MNGWVQACWRCGSGNAPNAVRCWICGAEQPGVARAETEPPKAAPAASFKRAEPIAVLAWFAVIGAFLIVGMLIAVELALEWPGLLVPYSVLALLLFGALGGTAWAHLRTSGSMDRRITEGVLVGASLVVIVLALLVLAFVTAIILLFAICLASLS